MQDLGYELPRIPIPRTWVNKGMKRAGAVRPPPQNNATRGGLLQLVGGLQTVPSGTQRAPDGRVGQQPCKFGSELRAQSAATEGIHSHAHVFGFKVPYGPQLMVGQTHWPLEQKSLQHSLSALQDPPFDTHVGVHAPSTHSSPSSQRLKQAPQWRSFLCRLTQLPLQQVWVERQRLRQLPQWRSLVRRFTHLSPQRVCPSEHRSSAQATPGTEPRALPTRAAPINLSALPRERVPLATPLASSSK